MLRSIRRSQSGVDAELRKVTWPRSDCHQDDKGKRRVTLYKSLIEVRIHVAIEGKSAQKKRKHKQKKEKEKRSPTKSPDGVQNKVQKSLKALCNLKKSAIQI